MCVYLEKLDFSSPHPHAGEEPAAAEEKTDHVEISLSRK